MKRLILSAAVVVSAFSMVVATPQGEMFKAKKIEPAPRTITSDAPESASVRQLAPGVTLSSVNGRKSLNILGQNQSKNIDLGPRKVQAKATVPNGYVLYESFEDWNGKNANWKPTGWSIDSKGSAGADEKWSLAKGEFPNPKCPDGNYFLTITEGTNQDEWYISPYVTPTEGMELSYWLYLNPVYLYVIDSKHVDFNKQQWIGTPEVAATLQIWAQAQGEDWKMLKDYSEEYKDWSFAELVKVGSETTELSKNCVDINEYYGKKMRIAFRYVGTDGGELYIDAIAVGYPTIDNVSYSIPVTTQYWGLIGSPILVGPAEAVGFYPAYTPVTWKNNNVDSDVNYSWSSFSAGTEEAFTSDDAEEFTVTYKPDYTDGQLPVCSMYSTPILHADAGTYSIPVDYQASFAVLQAGGRPVDLIDEDDATTYPLDILPFNYHRLDIDGLMVNESNLFPGGFGGGAIPVFGYESATSDLGNNADQYWLKYELNGEPQQSGDYVHLMGIGNLLRLDKDAAMVLEGANIYGFGQIWGGAELTLTIRSVINGKENNFDYNTMDVVATATITGMEILRQDSSKSFLCLPFNFKEPVVLRTSEKQGEIGAYFITLEGFRTEDVQYFIPLQNVESDPEGICNGYTIKHIDLTSHLGGKPYYEIAPMAYMEKGKRISFNGSFAFGLKAEYPWLATKCEAINLPVDGSAVEVALDSYYDSSELTVEAPAGVKTSIAGQYNNCVLKVSLDSKTNNVSGNVVIKGLGVELSIPVSVGAAGINDVISESAGIKAVYDLTGRRVEPADVTPGIYVVKYDDGTTRKLVVK